uniref:Uncharacterized protein n=1 Tax=Timema bartmani TaxID=61472 RepID=A0A7R9HXR8_9NEOP|nr:unnamed protein product [Timema bartmani]
MQPSTRQVLCKWSDAFRQLKRSHEKVARNFTVGRWSTPVTIHRFMSDITVQLVDPVNGLPVHRAHVTQLKKCLVQSIISVSSASQRLGQTCELATCQKKGRLKILFHHDYMGRNATWSVGNNFSTGNGSVLPKQAQVVICGAGMVANSVAYHLVQNGWTDVLVLEKEKRGELGKVEKELPRKSARAAVLVARGIEPTTVRSRFNIECSRVQTSVKTATPSLPSCLQNSWSKQGVCIQEHPLNITNWKWNVSFWFRDTGSFQTHPRQTVDHVQYQTVPETARARI